MLLGWRETLRIAFVVVDFQGPQTVFALGLHCVPTLAGLTFWIAKVVCVRQANHHFTRPVIARGQVQHLTILFVEVYVAIPVFVRADRVTREPERVTFCLAKRSDALQILPAFSLAESGTRAKKRRTAIILIA
jgi:hypothetical protein